MATIPAILSIKYTKHLFYDMVTSIMSQNDIYFHNEI